METSLRPTRSLPRLARLTTLATLLALTACDLATVDVEGAWIAEPPPNAEVLAGYLILRNHGDAPLTLTGASAPGFGAVEFHRTEVVDGIAHMRSEPRIEVAPGSERVFEPGGFHLMLLDPVARLSEGMDVAVVLSFAGREDLTVHFEVRRGGFRL